MKEALASYLWQNQLFNAPLTSDDGELILVQDPGMLNRDAGPDYSNAKIKIGTTTWAGNVEIHVHSSDWFQHKHEQDPAYDNIILHVVMINDSDIYRTNGEKIPTVSLQGKYSKHLEERYQAFLSSRQWIACEGQLHTVKPIILHNWLERVAVERFESRSGRIMGYLKETHYDWEQSFFQLLCRSFGFKTNAEPFEILGKQVPLKILQREAQTLLQAEAFLFGQAGFLDNKLHSAYYEKLQLAFAGVKAKHQLETLPGHIWKFMRLRPSNFPTIRIAQLASFIRKSPHLLRPVLEASTVEEIQKLYNVNASDFWINHYRFEKPQTTNVGPKKLGETAVHLILINAVIPFLFVYGKYHNQSVYQDKALDWLMQIPPEKNHITKKYIARGFPCKHALHSQALIQMRENYCQPKQCLQCHIGHHLLSKL